MQTSHLKILLGCLLILLTLATYVGSLANGFINYEDLRYVTANGPIESPRIWKLLGYAFSLSSVEWHPLTWISHGIDSAAFGRDAGAHHLVSLLLHALVVTLLFIFLSGTTKRPLESALASAIFAVHPLNVETVGWVSQRKNILGGVFWMLTLITYARYARKRTTVSYLQSLAACALGTLCSSALTVMPAILLVVDFWPLRRLQSYREGSVESAINGVSWRTALSEKIPFAVLSIITILMTRLVWMQPGMFHTLVSYSPQTQAANTVTSYGFYLYKMFWPRKLAPIYSVTGDDIPGIAGVALLVGLMLITALAFAAYKRRPYITAGWLWYVVTLFPFSGIIQLGDYAFADRYSYLPLIGVFIILAWGIPDLFRSLLPGLTRRVPAFAKLALAVVVVLSLSVLSWRQVLRWENSITLMLNTVAITRNNFVAYYYLGNALDDAENIEDATRAYQTSIAINPAYVPSYINLGTRLGRDNEPKAAEEMFRKAISYKPDYPKAYYNWGVALTVMGQYNQAADMFNKAIALQPDYGIAYSNLAALYFLRGDYERSWSYVQTARKYGAEPSSKLVRQLAHEMPEPGT